MLPRPVLASHGFRLLACPMHRPGSVVMRNELTEHLCTQDFAGGSNAIETVRGLAYQLADASLMQVGSTGAHEAAWQAPEVLRETKPRPIQ